MLLKHLYDFAQSRHLLDDLAFKADTPVRWLIHLDAQGALLGQGPQETEGSRKNKGKEFKIPKTSRAANSGTVADFLVDDIGAIFCLNTKPGELPNKRAVQKLQAKYQDFWRQVEEAKTATGDARFEALCKFKADLGENPPPFLRLDDKGTGWLMRTASGEEKPLASDLLTFVVTGADSMPLFESETAQKHWRTVYAREAEETEEAAERGLCLVTGESNTPLARTHTPMVTGLPKPAKGTGAGIVGFESDSFRSYGFKQSYNAPTSVVASKGYLLALQFLSKRQDHWLSLGPAWLCFWAAQSESASSLFAQLLNKPDSLTVRKFMTTPWAGIENPPPDMEKFFAVTLTAAGPRIVVKEWLQTTVAEASDNFRRWFTDLELVVPQRPPAKAKPTGEEKEFHPLSVYWLSRTTISDEQAKKMEKNLPPDVPAQLYRAALEGSTPSISLIKPILDQLHSKLVRDENYQLLYDQSRFSLLKLILNRNRKNNTMEIKPELTANTDDAAYNCGRLLAVFENLQQCAHEWKLEGATIIERYFAAASTAPMSAFGILWRLHFHHLKKLTRLGDKGKAAAAAIEAKIAGICTRFGQTDEMRQKKLPPELPRTLDLQAQGRFALGFYQQQAEDAVARQAAKDKKNNSETENQ